MNPPEEDAILACPRLGHCPMCGGPNGCRIESGEAYKGTCWCVHPVLCPAALDRLVGHLPEPRCLCRNCLERIAANPTISLAELAAVAEPGASC